MLDIYPPVGLIFQCHIFLPLHTLHGVLEARMLVCHFLLQWTTFCQNHLPWPVVGKGEISQGGVPRLSHPVASRPCPTFCKWWFMQQLSSRTALRMRTTRCSLVMGTSRGRPVWASLWKHCCWAGAALGQHHHCYVRLCHGSVMAPLRLCCGCCYSYRISRRRGRHAIQERVPVSAVPKALRVFFQPLCLCLATLRPADSKQDNWPHQQDQQYSRPPWVALHMAWLRASLSYTRLWSIYGEGHGTHSSALAWRIPGMEEPGGLPSMGSHRAGHDWLNLAAAVMHIIIFDSFLRL